MRYLEQLPVYLQEFFELQALGTAADAQVGNASVTFRRVWDSLFLDAAPGLIIDRWEKILGLQNKGLALAERRSEVITRLNSRAPITPKKLRVLLAQMTGCSVELAQHPETFQFDVTIYRRDADVDLNRVRAYIDQVKPANQTYTILLVNGCITAATYAGGVIMVGDRIKICQI